MSAYFRKYRVHPNRNYSAFPVSKYPGLIGIDVVQLPKQVQWTILCYWDNKEAFDACKDDFDKELNEASSPTATFEDEGPRYYFVRPQQPEEKAKLWEITKWKAVAFFLGTTTILGAVAAFIDGVQMIQETVIREPDIAFVDPKVPFVAYEQNTLTNTFKAEFVVRNQFANRKCQLDFGYPAKGSIVAVDGDNEIPVRLDPLSDSKISVLEPGKTHSISITGRLDDLKNKRREFEIQIECAPSVSLNRYKKTVVGKIRLIALPRFSYKPIEITSDVARISLRACDAVTEIYAGEKLSKGMKVLASLPAIPGACLRSIDMVEVSQPDDFSPRDPKSRFVKNSSVSFTTPTLEVGRPYKLSLLLLSNRDIEAPEWQSIVKQVTIVAD